MARRLASFFTERGAAAIAKPALPIVPTFDANALLAALPRPVMTLDADGRIAYVNQAAEQFLAASASHLIGQRLDSLVRPDSPIFALVDQARQHAGTVAEHGVTLANPRIGQRAVSIEAAALPEMPGMVVVMLQESSIADKIDRQLTHRSAARSVTGMAALLAHEVKNPLSGIRGAAQLLEQNARAPDRPLTRLIIDETDRICALVDRMEAFADGHPIERTAVNIHRVLEHVRTVAQNGFARKVRFVERYDPSLPPVLGNRDMLVQVFLNMVKNASEALPQGRGEIVLSTSFQHGVRLAVPGSERRTHLPLVVGVQDNGEGIPEDLRPHLFDPFVTTKAKGSGLGLALVAKVVGDHGGVIEFDSEPGRTNFRVLLPMHDGEELDL